MNLIESLCAFCLYAYDDFDRLTGVRYDAETEDRYSYEYDASGSCAMVRDNHLSRVAQTEYDLTERPMGTQLRNADGSLIYRTELDYDAQNRLVGFGEEVGGETYKTTYTYDNDNRVTEMSFGEGHTVGYSFDNLGRVNQRTVGSGTEVEGFEINYDFVAGGYGEGSATPLIAKITQPHIPFEYTYDNRGNIISEKRGELTTTYEYDALGQLVRVNDPHESATWVYNYDCGGNITSKVHYAYTTDDVGAVQETIPYVYADTNWKDKLTAYNGQTITYDAIGNPLNDGTWTYTWQHGRQLKQMSKTGTTVEFKYDHNGLRIQKIVNEVETNYTLHGKLITHLTCGIDKLHFFYDAQSKPAKVEYNDAMYTYVHNLQGDIVGILDSDGELVVEYKYNAWGKPLSTTGSLADTLGKVNPFRYRGYVYDEETGLYYLRSRYYDPVRGRFVNADTLIGMDKSIFQHNIFEYCHNNPVIHKDADGKLLMHAITRWLMDDFGHRIFWHWMNGFGQKLTIRDDKKWNDYLLSNGHFEKTVKKIAKDVLTQSRYDNEGKFSERTHLDLSGGEGGGYFTGHELINGTNKRVGDFELNGRIYSTSVPNTYYVEAEYVIHDIVDPEFSYGWLEYSAYTVCKLYNFWILGGYDYELEISGNITYYVEF